MSILLFSLLVELKALLSVFMKLHWPHQECIAALSQAAGECEGINSFITH